MTVKSPSTMNDMNELVWHGNASTNKKYGTVAMLQQTTIELTVHITAIEEQIASIIILSFVCI